MLPNLIIIGAMKGGTTSLHSYLDLHPQISMSQVKELNFFIADKPNWSKGVQWYESNFAGDAKIRGESSPNYTMCHLFRGVPERMYSVVPEARLIYIVRDPVDRIASHYVHECYKGREKQSISKALTDLEYNHYVLCSKYYMQLGQYLNCFPPSSILIMTLEDLYRDRHRTLQTVFRFLEVDDAFCHQGFSEVLYKSDDKKRKSLVGEFASRVPGRRLVKSLLPSRLVRAYYALSFRKVKKPTLDERLRQQLTDHLQDDVNSLRRYTGSSFEDWSL